VSWAPDAGRERERRLGMELGLEMFGGVGDSDKGITASGSITEHYISPNLLVHLPKGIMVKIGGAVGLTNVSQDLFRAAIAYEF